MQSFKTKATNAFLGDKESSFITAFHSPASLGFPPSEAAPVETSGATCSALPPPPAASLPPSPPPSPFGLLSFEYRDLLS